MKLIVKNKPTSLHHKLVEFQKNINGTYPNLTTPLKQELLKALLEEQGYICAYCMQKINETNSTIEHIIGQNFIDEYENKLGEENQLNYDNFLAVCDGKSCKDNLHCDKSRANYQKNRPLFVTPLENRFIQNIKFSEKGLIYYKDFVEIEEIVKLKNYNELDEDSNIKYDLQKVLNLNCDNLKSKRINLINALKRFTKNWSNQDRIKKELVKYSCKSNNQYEELTQVAIYFLSKRLK
ncbi:hypothetical protein N5S92_08425 [Aliarcobacter cryaerophilus]|uniref:hypothetical protein n=1 Tax=Aliarcobacter cryaerophilus TaxID=28198 RepID=UPI0021B45932|nr:hypothetical protein [Aliarcobacter cryaerophilus]MCT7502016.1 hypothetical protein [Aliarcobacter cryaerophilus]